MTGCFSHSPIHEAALASILENGVPDIIDAVRGYPRHSGGNGCESGVEGLYQTATGPVTVYVTGELTLRGNGSVMGSSANPSWMLIQMGSGSQATLEQEGSMTGSTDLHGMIYGPQAEIDITGNAEVYGSIIAQSVDVSGNASIHYDEDLDDRTDISNSYNVTRIGYLAKLFPDARFVIPVRDPVWHIASLMKQHRLFLDGQRDNLAAQRHLRRVGHFEFGMDRRPISLGDDANTEEIATLWRDGEEVRGWARYWARMHHYIADLIESELELRPAICVLRYEDLCADPRVTLLELLSHCQLPVGSAFLGEATGRFHQPTYYQPRFSAAELSIIVEETAIAARRFGYQPERTLTVRQSAQ